MIPNVKIGNVAIEKTACLAPMAGVADRAFRLLCREYGASYVIGEMASAKGLTMSDRKTKELLEVTGEERPMAVQIFGDDPLVMAEAAVRCMDFSPDILDINMGCPAPKITSGGAGSALMKNPALAEAIIRAVVRAVPVPVTVKFRKGWDGDSANAVEFAKRAEAAGAAAICIHGRTRQQMYAPPVDLDCIREVKQAVRIPVIGNGDVNSVESAVRMYEQTGCDLVMIGRGALGHPGCCPA
ncbi:MAG: tRNA dihydrouridine synthase [Oscillospiraceae bacterium]